MCHFGQSFLDARTKFGAEKLVLFESDVASAFLSLPAHPLWQLRQVVKIDGKYYIVRRLVFGNHASRRIWCAVSGLICWIANECFGIVDLFVYMDDYFSWDFLHNVVLWNGKMTPQRQARLLDMWTFLGCPFEDRKQEHGQVLKIIGFWVDVVRGSISLHPDSATDIVNKINHFLSDKTRCPAIRDRQRLSVHINWLFNVLPLGRPALCEVYQKIADKTNIYGRVFINNDVRADLTWLANTIPDAIGVRFVDNLHCDDSEHQ